MVSRKAGKTHAESSAQSREALLRAGADLLLEASQRNPFGALRVREICARAAYSTGAFYAHWPKTDDYYRELGRVLLDMDPLVFAQEFADLRSEAERDVSASPRDAISGLAESDIGQLLGNDLWDAVELLNVTWARTELRGQAARGYRDVDEDTANVYGVLLRKWDREVRPPLTETELGALLQALVEGCALRQKVDPEAGSVRLYAVGVSALLAVLTRKQGDDRSVEDALDIALDTL